MQPRFRSEEGTDCIKKSGGETSNTNQERFILGKNKTEFSSYREVEEKAAKVRNSMSCIALLLREESKDKLSKLSICKFEIK